MIYHGEDVKEALDSYRGLILKGVTRYCYFYHGDIDWDESFYQLTFEDERCFRLQSDGLYELRIIDEAWDECDYDDETIDEIGKWNLYDVTNNPQFKSAIGQRLTSFKYYRCYGYPGPTDNSILGVKIVFETQCIRFFIHGEDTFIVVDHIQKDNDAD